MLRICCRRTTYLRERFVIKTYFKSQHSSKLCPHETLVVYGVSINPQKSNLRVCLSKSSQTEKPPVSTKKNPSFTGTSFYLQLRFLSIRNALPQNCPKPASFFRTGAFSECKWVLRIFFHGWRIPCLHLFVLDRRKPQRMLILFVQQPK